MHNFLFRKIKIVRGTISTNLPQFFNREGNRTICHPRKINVAPSRYRSGHSLLRTRYGQDQSLVSKRNGDCQNSKFDHHSSPRAHLRNFQPKFNVPSLRDRSSKYYCPHSLSQHGSYHSEKTQTSRQGHTKQIHRNVCEATTPLAAKLSSGKWEFHKTEFYRGNVRHGSQTSHQVQCIRFCIEIFVPLLSLRIVQKSETHERNLARSSSRLA